MPKASRAAGRIICCGITPAIPSICFIYQTGETASDEVSAMQGPIHPELKIAMDMSIQMKVPSGAVCTLALSFNNNGPLGTWFRYICDNGTYIARYDELVDGYESPSMFRKSMCRLDGIELQDREFIAAIQEKREPNSSVGAGPARHASARSFGKIVALESL